MSENLIFRGREYGTFTGCRNPALHLFLVGLSHSRRKPLIDVTVDIVLLITYLCEFLRGNLRRDILLDQLPALLFDQGIDLLLQNLFIVLRLLRRKRLIHVGCEFVLVFQSDVRAELLHPISLEQPFRMRRQLPHQLVIRVEQPLGIFILIGGQFA